MKDEVVSESGSEVNEVVSDQTICIVEIFRVSCEVNIHLRWCEMKQEELVIL